MKTFAGVISVLSPPRSITPRRGGASFIAGAGAPPDGSAIRFVQTIGFFALSAVALLFWGPAASAQTITVNALTATPASAQPGQTIVFTATMTANQDLANYPVEFSLTPARATSAVNAVFFVAFQAGEPITQSYSWTVPVGTAPGPATVALGVYDPDWKVPALAHAAAKFTVTAASASE